jgi:hypothetical protein
MSSPTIIRRIHNRQELFGRGCRSLG